MNHCLMSTPQQNNMLTAAASAMGKRPRAVATIASPMAATFLGNDIGFIEAFRAAIAIRRRQI